MKKLLVLLMAVVMTLSLAGCGGASAKESKFNAEQQALAQDFTEMTEKFNKTVDRVNASPELLSDEQLIKTMNELADEISAADEYFTSPETLTPEIMEGLKTAIEASHKFIAAAEKALDAVYVSVEISNFTGVDIYALALSPANNNEWGENLITEVIKDGEKVQGTLAFTEDTLVWDILVEDSEGTQLTFMGVDFSEASTDGANLILEGTEGGDYYASVN